jgi:AraC-like DNA-binding protein
MPKRTAAVYPPEAMLRIGATLALPGVLRGLGANPAAVLAEAGFDLGLFDDPGNMISYAARGRLLAHCVARTGCQHLGLLIGQQASLNSLGIVGLLVKYSPDVGSALRNLVRYLHLHVRGASTSLAVDGGSVIFGYSIHQPNVEAADQVGDGAVALMYNIVRGLCGPDWRPTEAWFAHRTPADVEAFKQFFKVRLRFDAEQNALVFSASWLERAMPAADSELRDLLQQQIDTLDLQHKDDFPEQVRSILRAAVPAGYAKSNQVAAMFSMHSRTLHRRLIACGVSFQDLLDETSFEIAQQLLTESANEIGEVATMLDFADARSFIRAFRRWSGTTPARWRADQAMLRRTQILQRNQRTRSSARV